MTARLFFLICLLLSAWQVAPANAQSTQPAKPAFEVHEWAVFVLDASLNQLNPDGIVTSTLPDFVDTRRQSAPPESKNDPCPVAVIRLIGPSSSTVDVMLEKSAGQFQTSWPKAENRSKQLLWRDLKLSSDSAAGKVQEIPAGHWFADLRASSSDFLSVADGPTENFLLYDVNMPYPSPLTIKSDSTSGLVLTNTGKNALQDLTLYRGKQGGMVASLRGKSRPRPAGHQALNQSGNPPLPTARQVNFRRRDPTLRPCRKLEASLTGAGVSPTDADLMVKILAKNAFDPRRLTAVYLMDDAEFDRILPLEVEPEPRKTVRVALVIIKNADPAAGTEVDDLIAQLGDPAWSKREEAYEALKKLGTAATPKLKAALKSKDLEIVWRAERLLRPPLNPESAFLYFPNPRFKIIA